MSNLSDFAIGPMSEPTPTTTNVQPVVEPESTPATRERPRFPNLTTITAMVLAAVLFAIGWLVGIVSVPCNWCMGALRAGWYDARRRGGL